MSGFDSFGAVARLCPSCGLCCNGVLFGDVQLQGSDDPEFLAAHGLCTKKKGRKLIFQQPCSCFDGRWCKIYATRPSRCRAFECGLLQRVQANELSPTVALRRIREAQRRVKIIHDLLCALGNADRSLPLMERYKQVVAQPIELSEARPLAQRSRLMRLMNSFMQMVHREFLA